MQVSFSIFLSNSICKKKKNSPDSDFSGFLPSIFALSHPHLEKTWNTVGTVRFLARSAPASHLAFASLSPCPIISTVSPRSSPHPRLPALFTYGPGILVTTAQRDLTHSRLEGPFSCRSHCRLPPPLVFLLSSIEPLQCDVKTFSGERKRTCVLMGE